MRSISICALLLLGACATTPDPQSAATAPQSKKPDANAVVTGSRIPVPKGKEMDSVGAGSATDMLGGHAATQSSPH